MRWMSSPQHQSLLHQFCQKMTNGAIFFGLQWLYFQTKVIYKYSGRSIKNHRVNRSNKHQRGDNDVSMACGWYCYAEKSVDKQGVQEASETVGPRVNISKTKMLVDPDDEDNNNVTANGTTLANCISVHIPGSANKARKIEPGGKQTNTTRLGSWLAGGWSRKVLECTFRTGRHALDRPMLRWTDGQRIVTVSEWSTRVAAEKEKWRGGLHSKINT